LSTDYRWSLNITVATAVAVYVQTIRSVGSSFGNPLRGVGWSGFVLPSLPSSQHRTYYSFYRLPLLVTNTTSTSVITSTATSVAWFPSTTPTPTPTALVTVSRSLSSSVTPTTLTAAPTTTQMSRERDRNSRRKKRSATSVARAYPNACADRPPAYSDYENYQPTWR
jgi:hypothetical protein